MKPKQIIGISALLVLGLALGAACSQQSSPAAQQLSPQTPPPTPAASQATDPDANVPRLNAAEVKRLVAEGKAVVLDVRSAESYKTEHVKGATSYPLDKIESGNYQDLPRDKRI